MGVNLPGRQKTVHDVLAPLLEQRPPRQVIDRALSGYLEQARRLLLERADPVHSQPAQTTPEFEHLRWFELPANCVRTHERRGDHAGSNASGN